MVCVCVWGGGSLISSRLTFENKNKDRKNVGEYFNLSL